MLLPKRFSLASLVLAVLLSISSAVPAAAQVTVFMQAVAEAAAADRDIAEFYKANGYKGIWTGQDGADKDRRAAFLSAIEGAGAHGLPPSLYDPQRLRMDLTSIRSERDLGQLEVAFSRLFLAYARDIQTGILTPSEIDSGLVREVPLRDRRETLAAFVESSPKAFIKTLPPTAPEYARLMKEKIRFEKLIARGGWGEQVDARKVEPGESGRHAVQLRNRLIAMGYLKRTASTSYDAAMKQAVSAFQTDHGLFSDGVAGAGTLAAINIEPETRLSQILVAMERERWLNMPRGKRHIWVNLTDFHARIIDDGKVTFQTRSVIGLDEDDRRSPEFSDEMEHMVVNPTWHVPRSIATKEYLPLLKRNPYAVSHLKLVNSRGQVVPREYIDFTQITARNFPFDMKQPPSNSNALGLVKFMFPNRYNIYLHDTPAKDLFGREKRDFSHGCIRLNDPFDFAYALLAKQEANPQAFFQSTLSTGRETYVNLEEHVPVHIVYRTAFTQAKGRMQFRGDVYGRDAKIWRALENAGVALGAVQG